MTIFLAGGAPTTPLAEAYDQFVQEAQDYGDRVAIAVLGSQAHAAAEVPVYAEPVLRRWPQAQIEPVWLVGADTVWPEAPETLAGLIVAGEVTSTVLESLLPVRDVLARLVHRDVPYFGYSAGVSVAARHAIVGGWRHQGRQIAPESSAEGCEALTIWEGLGLLGVTTQAHADTAGLLDRAVAALQVGPSVSALLIDEDACLTIDAVTGATTVTGTGRVTWLARHGDQIVLRFAYPRDSAHADGD